MTTQPYERVTYKDTYDDEDAQRKDELQKSEILDEEEQEEVLQDIRSRADKLDKTYQIVFCLAGVLLGALFLYLAYYGEQFMGLIATHRMAVIIHTLTGVGCLLAGLRPVMPRREAELTEETNANVSFFSSASTMQEETKPLWWKDPMLIVIIVVCIVQFVLWLQPIYDNIQIFKAQVLVFPLILPFFAGATEYALHVIAKTEQEVSDLAELKYHYKKL
jgi:hypothetical protein